MWQMAIEVRRFDNKIGNWRLDRAAMANLSQARSNILPSAEKMWLDLLVLSVRFSFQFFVLHFERLPAKN